MNIHIYLFTDLKKEGEILYTYDALSPEGTPIQITEKRYACLNANCNKTFKNKRNRNDHQRNLCNKPSRYKCAYCNRRSLYSADIKRHLVTKHSNLEVKIIELYNPHLEARKHKCPNPNCDKKYKCLLNLRNHINYECDKAPRFKCFYCDYRNAYEPRIRTHCKNKHPLLEPRSVTMME